MKIETQKEIDVILDEKRQRREEIDILVRSIIQFGFLPFTLLSGLFIGFISVEMPESIGKYTWIILPVLNQALFLLGIAFVMVLINMRVQARYVKTLEKRLNNIFEGNVNLWDSSGLLFHFGYSTIPYLIVLLMAMIITGYGLLACMTYKLTENIAILALNMIQLLGAIVSLLVEIFYFEKKHIRFYAEHMNKKSNINN